MLYLSNSLYIKLTYTSYINEHKERNIIIQSYIHRNESIDYVTVGTESINIWPYTYHFIDNELCLPSPKIVPINQIIFCI